MKKTAANSANTISNNSKNNTTMDSTEQLNQKNRAGNSANTSFNNSKNEATMGSNDQLPPRQDNKNAIDTELQPHSIDLLAPDIYGTGASIQNMDNTKAKTEEPANELADSKDKQQQPAKKSSLRTDMPAKGNNNHDVNSVLKFQASYDNLRNEIQTYVEEAGARWSSNSISPTAFNVYQYSIPKCGVHFELNRANDIVRVTISLSDGDTRNYYTNKDVIAALHNILY